jgi:UDP-N-acetylmuramate-alanine ligase
MDQDKHYFFCGIGGSGMLPLALILRGQGCVVEGSDRMLDQGRTTQKFDFLRDRGIRLHAQDGSGLTGPDQILVTSAAVEDSVPDVQAARRLGAKVTTRAELLATIFNAASRSIAIGGTSGKSTTTGMIGWILDHAGRDPTVMNGAVMKNFIAPDTPFASAVLGENDLFVSEVDESDGSITLYTPRIAVLTNIALDHKSLDELRALFRDFVVTAETVVLNLDNDETAALAAELPPGKAITFPGRLLVMFQPHGFGPLRLMKDAFIDCFARHLHDDDVLIMPDPVYFGGTVERAVTSQDIVQAVRARGRSACTFAERAACGDKLLELARPGDRIVVMGARDDTLALFAAELLDRLGP